MVRITSTPDFAGGLVTVAAGLLFVVHGLNYPMGTSVRMGAGFFPVLLGVVALPLGGLLLARSFVVTDRMGEIAWRPFIAVCAGTLLFGLTLPRLGLAPALAAAAIATSLGDPTSRLWQTILLVAVLCVFSWLVFLRGLGLVLPLFRMSF